MKSPSLRCPVCSDELSLRTQQSCPTCETPIHSDCREYIGGCARFACPEAATPRGRVLEFVTVCLDQQLLSARALTMCLAAWAAICTFAGLYCIVYYPYGGTNGFGYPTLALLHLLCAHRLHEINPLALFIVSRLGFLIPTVAWVWASSRQGRLKDVRSRLGQISSTPDGQLALLQTFAPNAKRSGLGAVVGPIAKFVGVSAMLVALYLAVSHVTGWNTRNLPKPTVVSTQYPHMSTTYSVSGESVFGLVMGFTLLGAALISLGRSTTARWHLQGRSLRLASLWREELEVAQATALFDTELKSGKPMRDGDATRPTLRQSENPADIKRHHASMEDPESH